MTDAADTYKANRPGANIINDDVNNIFPVLEQQEDIDFVFGGPPCQGFSVAGKMNPNDDRSKLIFTFLKAVEVVRPRAFVMENVKALAKLSKWSEVRKKFFEECQRLGYMCAPFVLNATEYGVPQKRERVFFVGIRDSKDIFFDSHMKNILEKMKNQAPTVREALKLLGPAGTENNPNTCTARITFAANPVMRRSPYAGMYFNGQGRPINIDGYANTLPASMGGNKTPFVDEDYLHGNATQDWVVDYHEGLTSGSITPKFAEAPSNLRRITIKEAAKLQTFPDDYHFCGSKGAIYTQIGNAVPSKLAEAIARATIEYLETEPNRLPQ